MAWAYEPTSEEFQEYVNWYHSRPPEVKAMIERFPPGCQVRTKEGHGYMCPGPGEVVPVYSYLTQDDGSVTMNVVSQLGFTAEVDPEKVEVVDSDPAFSMLARAKAAAPTEEAF